MLHVFYIRFADYFVYVVPSFYYLREMESEQCDSPNDQIAVSTNVGFEYDFEVLQLPESLNIDEADTDTHLQITNITTTTTYGKIV